MADSLEYQRGQLERALAKPDMEHVVREALEAQLKSVRLKLNSKAKRKATLPDGTEVTAGSEVYSFSPAFVGVDRGERPSVYPGSVNKLTVRSVSPDGSEISISSSGRHSYSSIREYRGSIPAAKIAAVQQARQSVTAAQRELRDRQIRLDYAKQALNLSEHEALDAGVEDIPEETES